MDVHGRFHRVCDDYHVYDSVFCLSYLLLSNALIITIGQFLFTQTAAVFLAIKGIQDVINNRRNGGHATFADLASNSIFRNIIISLIATTGLYLLSSILFVSPVFIDFIKWALTCYGDVQLEPWHMFTSFVQYLLMAPSYISVLDVYAVSSYSCS